MADERPTPRPISEGDRQKVRTLHAAGMTRNDIARELGRSGSTISKIADEEGLAFDRGTQVAAATAARQTQNRESRARLMELLLEDAHKLRQELWTPCTVYNFGGKDNTFETAEIDQPDFAGQKAIMQSVGVAVDKILRLESADSETGVDEARSMLGAIAAGLQVAADRLGDDDA